MTRLPMGLLVMLSVGAIDLSIHGTPGLDDEVYRYVTRDHTQRQRLAGDRWQGVALEVGSVLIGALDDAALAAVLHLEEAERPLYDVPLGRLP